MEMIWILNAFFIGLITGVFGCVFWGFLVTKKIERKNAETRKKLKLVDDLHSTSANYLKLGAPLEAMEYIDEAKRVLDSVPRSDLEFR